MYKLKTFSDNNYKTELPLWIEENPTVIIHFMMFDNNAELFILYKE